MRDVLHIVALLALAGTAAGAARDAPPSVAGQVRLSAQPATLANGPAGPLNRIAFDVVGFDPGEARSRVTCHYPGGTVYLCAVAADVEPGAADDARRITVTIPDLGRGGRVSVRFANDVGRQDVPVDLANVPQVVHEIEALLLPNGGATTVRGDGTEVPVRQLATHRATTMPALAAPAAPVTECERIVAEWVNASATDPVFTSRFGPLNGSLVPARAVPRGALVGPDTLPEWLISYPLGATRVQFIAHYEVIYRVAPCAARIRSG